MKQKLVRLPVTHAEAVCAVLAEREAGGVDDLRDALGIENAEASRMMKRLEESGQQITDGPLITSEQVVVVLSRSEAWQLWRAADNSIGNPVDDSERLALLGSRAEVEAGLRALEKLNAARQEAARNSPGPAGGAYARYLKTSSAEAADVP